MTPSGMPASMAIRPSSIVVNGVISDGLITTVFPVARAGARLLARIIRGWLKGVRSPHTPSGQRCR
jgi:hypothetical protein